MEIILQNRRKAFLNIETSNKILALLDKGISDIEIHKDIGISFETLIRFKRENNYNTNQKVNKK